MNKTKTFTPQFNTKGSNHKMTTLKTATTLLSAMAVALATAGTAQATTYTSGVGTTTVTATSSTDLAGLLGVAPSNPASPFGPVTASTTGTVPSAYSPPLLGSQWVSAVPGFGNVAQGGFYTFTQALTITPAGSAFTVNGNLLSDNALVGIVLNDGGTTQYAKFDTANYVADSNTMNSYTIAQTFGPYSGTASAPDTIGFIVYNENQNIPQNPAAIDYSLNVASVSPAPEPTSVASFGLGGLGLLGLMLRARKSNRSAA